VSAFFDRLREAAIERGLDPAYVKHEWFRWLGRQGGSCSTERKRKAVRENAARARAIRDEKRKRGECK